MERVKERNNFSNEGKHKEARQKRKQGGRKEEFEYESENYHSYPKRYVVHYVTTISHRRHPSDLAMI